MNNENFKKLSDRAGEMALRNIWGENAYKINMMILKADGSNLAACTRLAKYYMLCGNIEEAKNMYLKALEIDPNSRGAMNNLIEIEREEHENVEVEKIKTVGELFRMGQSSMVKGRYKLAEKLFLKAYGIEPVLKYAICLAGLYGKMGKRDSIEKLYKQFIEGKHSKADIEAINNEFKVFGLNA